MKKIFLFIFLPALLFLGIHVTVRMQCVEGDYFLGKLNHRFEKISLRNKELKAIKAGLLSVKNLRNIAQENNLVDPSSGRIIRIRK